MHPRQQVSHRYISSSHTKTTHIIFVFFTPSPPRALRFLACACCLSGNLPLASARVVERGRPRQLTVLFQQFGILTIRHCGQVFACSKAGTACFALSFLSPLLSLTSFDHTDITFRDLCAAVKLARCSPCTMHINTLYNTQ